MNKLIHAAVIAAFAGAGGLATAQDKPKPPPAWHQGKPASMADSKLAPVPGIDIVGGLPEPIQRITHFAAGIPPQAASAEAAARLLALLRSERVRAGMTEGGIQPAG